MTKPRLSGSRLKWIAVISMLIDHLAGVVLYFYLLSFGTVIVTTQGTEAYERLKLLYRLLRIVGRLAFPIFCFLLVEGFLHTHHLKKYVRNLGIFAVLSEIPFDLAFSSKIVNVQSQNVFWTLLIGLFCLILLQKAEENYVFERQKLYLCYALIVAAGALIAHFGKTDYGAGGVLVICFLYLLRGQRFTGAFVGSVILTLKATIEIATIADILLLDCYDGTRGKQHKYFFYFFYPVHLLLLYGISFCLGCRG